MYEMSSFPYLELLLQAEHYRQNTSLYFLFIMSNVY